MRGVSHVQCDGRGARGDSHVQGGVRGVSHVQGDVRGVMFKVMAGGKGR